MNTSSGVISDLKLAIRYAIPFWVFAIGGFHVALNSNPHHNFLFGFAYAIILFPGYIIAMVIAGPAWPLPWPLALLCILIGQYAAVYFFIRFLAFCKFRLHKLKKEHHV